MTRDEIITLVLNRAGQRGDDTVLRGQLEAEIVLVQSRLEGGVRCGPNDSGVFLPWFLVKEVSTLAQAADADVIALPPDFLMEYDEELGPTVFYYSDNCWLPLVKSDLNLLRVRWPRPGNAPKGYDVLGGSIYVYPRAIDARLLRMVYYGAQPTLSATVASNEWTTRAADLMVAEVSFAGARLTRDDNWQVDAGLDSKGARERLRSFHTAWVEAARDRSMGEAP